GPRARRASRRRDRPRGRPTVEGPRPRTLTAPRGPYVDPANRTRGASSRSPLFHTSSRQARRGGLSCRAPAGHSRLGSGPPERERSPAHADARRRARDGSVLIRADDLAEVPGGELLEDAELIAGLEAVRPIPVAVVDDTGGIPGLIDRLRL